MRLQQSRFSLMLLGIVVAGILILAINMLVLHEQQKKTDKLRKEYAAKQAEFDSNEEHMRNIEQDRAKLATINARLDILDSNLADYKYIPTYLQQMQRTSVQTGNIIRTIVPGDCAEINFDTNQLSAKLTGGENITSSAPNPNNGDKPSGKYQIMGINLEIQGSYTSIIQLLDKFRMFPKMIYVKNMEVTPIKDKTGMTMLTARMQTFAVITPDQFETKDGKSGDNGGTVHE